MDIGMPVKDGFIASREIINFQNNLNNLMRGEKENEDVIVNNSINDNTNEIITLIPSLTRQLKISANISA